MSALDTEELRRLSPEERIRKLRQLEEERKKDLKKAEELINASLDELEAMQKEEPPEPRQGAQPLLPKETEGLEKRVIEEELPEHRENNIQYAISQYHELVQIAGEENISYSSLQRAIELYEKLDLQREYMSRSEQVRKISEGSSRLMEQIFGSYSSKHEYRPERGGMGG